MGHNLLIKEIAGKLNKFFKIFIVSFLIGLQLAFLIVYWYTVYKDETIAGEGIRDTISYQGKITNAEGVPPPDGQYKMRFVIYDQLTGGNVLWTEVWNGTTNGGLQTNSSTVTVSNGVFIVELNSLCTNWVGDCASNGGVTFATDSFYLQVELDYDDDGSYEEVFTPRKRFTAIPYAMNADKLDGRDYTEFVLKDGDIMTGSLTVPTLVVEKIEDSATVAFYQFNGDAKDSSKNALNGALVNSADITNQVLELNGADQYVSITDTDLLSFGDGTTDSGFTISAWLMMFDATNFNIINKRSAGQEEWYLAVDADDKLIFTMYDQEATIGSIGRISTDTLTQYEGQWIFFTATYDGAGDSSNIALYINGEAISTVTADNGNPYTAMGNFTSPVYIGKYSADYADGKIDDLKIIGRELSFDEVKINYNSQLRNNLQTNKITSQSIRLEGFDDEDGDSNMDLEGGNIYWDKALNRFSFDQSAYVPSFIPYFNNAIEDRDYTHYQDNRKILAYDFNESPENIETGVTTVVDLVENADGVIYSDQAGINWINEGYIGYALENYTIAGNYLDFSDLATYLDTYNADFDDSGSIEAWVKADNLDSTEDNYFISLFAQSTNQISLYKESTDDSLTCLIGSTTATSDYIFTDNNWHHIVLNWDNGSLAIYVDNQLTGLDNTTYSGLASDSFTAFYLLAASVSGLNWHGAIDSLAIYNDVLSTVDIANHYKAAFYDLNIINSISDGNINSSLADLHAYPNSTNQANKTDPAYYGDPNKSFALSFFEGSGSTAAAMKFSGNANQININGAVNGAKWVKAGYYGYGMSFDGVDDNIVFAEADDTGGDLDFGTADFALEFWLKGLGTTDTNDNESARIISKRDNNTGFEVYLDKETVGDNFDRVVFFLGDGSITVTATAESMDMSDGKWHHVLISFDRGNGLARILRDGASDSNIDISSITGSVNNTADLYISSDDSGNYYAGSLDSLVLYKGETINDLDAYNRVYGSPEFQIVSNRSLYTIYHSYSAPLAALNASQYGQGSVLGISATNNTSGYPLAIWNDSFSTSPDIYKLISFGNTILNPSSVEFGNLTWDASNSKFILSQSLEVQGELTVDSISTDSNDEYLATDIIRHTLTSGEVSVNSFTESWSTATTKEIVNLHAVTVLEADANDTVVTDDWIDKQVDHAIKYDGSTITVTEANNAGWSENDIVTIYIVYEK